MILDKYEELLDEAIENNITIFEHYDFSGTRIRGLYCDSYVALSDTLETNAQKICILSEEMGHFYTSNGNIIDMSIPENIKQEHQARAWAYNKLVGLGGIISAYNAHCQNLYEAAEHLGITEEFLADALSYYRCKYGTFATIDNYIIYFNPTLVVFELII